MSSLILIMELLSAGLYRLKPLKASLKGLQRHLYSIKLISSFTQTHTHHVIVPDMPRSGKVRLLTLQKRPRCVQVTTRNKGL